MLFKRILNVFGITKDFLLAGFDELGRDHGTTLHKVLQICRQANLNLNKDKCLFRCTSIPFLSEVISWQGVRPDPRKVQTLTVLPPFKSKRELQSFLIILNYLSRILPVTAEICEPLQKLISVKAEYSWNKMYQNSYDKAKKILFCQRSMCDHRLQTID